MSAPALFFGQRGGPKVLRCNQGASDDGRPIIFRVQPAEVAPAGPHGECAFLNLYLTITHSMEVPVRVIPILDGLRLDDEITNINLPAPPSPGLRVTTPYEVALSRAAFGFDGISVIGRVALRGSFFSFLAYTPEGLAAGALIIESAELEYEVLRESREAV
jgi:hypothetical protein